MEKNTAACDGLAAHCFAGIREASQRLGRERNNSFGYQVISRRSSGYRWRTPSGKAYAHMPALRTNILLF